MYILLHVLAHTGWIENGSRIGEKVKMFLGILEEEKYFAHMKLIMIWYVSYYQVVMGRGHIAVALWLTDWWWLCRRGG